MKTEIHYIYKITCTKPSDSQKFYIGVHSTYKEPLTDNYMGSSIYLDKAIKSIGKEHFIKEVLSTWETRELANQEEIRLHSEINVAADTSYFNRNNANNKDFCSLGQVTVRDTRTNTYKKVSVTEFNSNNYYEHNSKGMMTIYDVSDKTIKHVTKEDYLNNPNYKNQNTKIFKIFNNNDELVFECCGNFYNFCSDNNLPYNAFRESIREDKKLYQKGNPKKKHTHFIIYKGWYAKREELI